jgi:hypothetical protein
MSVFETVLLALIVAAVLFSLWKMIRIFSGKDSCCGHDCNNCTICGSDKTMPKEKKEEPDKKE